MVEQAPAQAHHLEKAAPRMIVVLVKLEMLREAVDALGQEGDLHLWRPRVVFFGCVLSNDLLLAFGAERHRKPFQLLGELKAAAAGMSSSRVAQSSPQRAYRSGELARLIHQFAAIAREKFASPYKPLSCASGR